MWEDLEDDIAELFEDFSKRPAKADERYARWRAWRFKVAERKRDEARRRRGSTTLSIETRRRSYATRYQQLELPLTKKGDLIEGIRVDMKAVKDPSSGLQAKLQRRAPEDVHLDDGNGKAVCGAKVAGIMVVERANRVSCTLCHACRK